MTRVGFRETRKITRSPRKTYNRQVYMYTLPNKQKLSLLPPTSVQTVVVPSFSGETRDPIKRKLGEKGPRGTETSWSVDLGVTQKHVTQTKRVTKNINKVSTM